MKPTVLFFLGFLFRLFLAFNAYDPIIFDAKGYSQVAMDFLAGTYPIDCCAKNVGYGAFLALIYALFGVENLVAVRLVHIALDLVSAWLIYAIARPLFGERAAKLSFLLYLFNPFTAAFTGLVLAESFSIFLMLLLLFLLTKKLWLRAGIIAGLLLFTRHSFYYFLPVLFIIVGLRNLKALGLLAVGFLIASSYSLIVYYKTFGKIAVVPPYNLKYEIMYLNFFRWKYPEVEFKGELPQYGQILQSYWNTPLEGKAAHSEKYKQLLLARLPGEWPTFVANLLWNEAWLWDKDHLYTYIDRFYPGDRWPLRILNGALILFWLIGMIRAKRSFVFLFSLLMFFYIAALFPLLSNESRHTLIYYPILSLWAGYGLHYFIYRQDLRTAI